MANKTKKSTKNSSVKGFSDQERGAMQERARELMLGKGDGESAVLAKIAEMPKEDQVLAERIHKIVRKNAPTLTPKTWYGMPAYANEDGKVVCFFQSAAKFKTRYATLGFQHDAHLDEGQMWPVSFAVKKLSAADEAKIATLVKRAVS